jgi:hypothetical protein
MWDGKKLTILKKEHREYKFKSIDEAQIINKFSKMNRSREFKFDSNIFFTKLYLLRCIYSYLNRQCQYYKTDRLHLKAFICNLAVVYEIEKILN